MKKIDIARKIVKIRTANKTFGTGIGASRLKELYTKQELQEVLEGLENGTRKY
jgi:hypothetical protein